MSARLDGLDPFSTSAQDQLMFHVYQRRQIADIFKLRATVAASLGHADAAANALDKFMDIVMPFVEAQPVAEVNIDEALESVRRDLGHLFS